MPKIYKIIIFLCSLGVILMVTRFVFAAGNGYFLGKNNNLYILDNLHINGYLAVENTVSPATGKLGDVLIGNYLLLDENNKLYFCEDIRSANTPLNKDCNSKMLIWTPNSLEVKSDRYQLTANKLSAPNGTINFIPAEGKNVQTKYPIRITDRIAEDNTTVTGCFSNDGSGTCGEKGEKELKSGNVYLKTLYPLSKNELLISAQKLIFKDINLGSDKNINNQWLCWKAGLANSCKTAKGSEKNDRWIFSVAAAGATYTNTTGNDIVSINNGAKLCCHLNVSF
ncbi:MAG: hypothetical protein NTX82_03245 [Candidatus Parcubacteria bacterium]|nr:hypothetical protein [Candidatus Parcubacteria bacterium]